MLTTNKTVITAIVDNDKVNEVLNALAKLADSIFVANTPYIHKEQVGEFKAIQGEGAFKHLDELIEKNGVEATAKAIMGNAWHVCEFKDNKGNETRYLSALGKPNKALTTETVNELLSHGVHKVTFTKKDGTIVTYAATRDWAWCKENAEAIGYKEPKGTDGGKHAAQDAAYNLVTFFKVGIDANDGGYRRFALDKLVSID